MTAPYAAMLRLAGQRCVIVGGGTVAARKLGPLLAAGAEVVVIAPEIGPAIERAALEGRVELARRAYRRGDLGSAALAFVATDSRAVNAAVADEARRQGIPVNVADDPAGSTFHVPAVLRRADLTVAISTDGRSPAFARRLRQEIEQVLTPQRLALLDLYAELRAELAEAGRPTAEAAWDAVDGQALQLLREGRRSEAEQLVRRSLAIGPGAS